MKRIFRIFIFFIFSYEMSGQIQGFDQWYFVTDLGIEKHDKRLFNYPDKETLLEDTPSYFGTAHVRFMVNRSIKETGKFCFFSGIGIGYEKATFRRPFNHIYFENNLDDVLRFSNKYEKFYCLVSATVFYRIKNSWYLLSSVHSNLLFHRSLDNTNLASDAYPYNENTFELDEISFTSGINRKVKNLILGLNTRLVNFQKIDSIIFNRLIRDPREGQKWEWHNPFQLNFSVGYMW